MSTYSQDEIKDGGSTRWIILFPRHSSTKTPSHQRLFSPSYSSLMEHNAAQGQCLKKNGVTCVHMCAWADRPKALYGEDEIYNDGVMSSNADLMAKHWTAAFLQLNYDTLSFTTMKHKVESLIYQVSWRLFFISRAARMQGKKNVLFLHISIFISIR